MSIANAYLSSVLARSPLGAWQLNDAAGPSAVDATGNGRTGTYAGAPTFRVAGPIGTSTPGIGVAGGAGASTPLNDTTVPPAGPWTLVLWFKTAVAGTDKSLWTRFNSRPGLHITSGDALELDVFDGAIHTRLTSVATVIDGLWHMAAATYDGANARLYLDGALSIGPTVCGNYNVGTIGKTFLLGVRDDAAAAFSGSLAQGAIYTSALTLAQITAQYNAAKLRLGLDYRYRYRVGGFIR